MADQRPWWKLWDCGLTDEKILSLSPAERWAWAALATHVNMNGEKGSMMLCPQSQIIAMKMGCAPAEILPLVRRFPNVELLENRPVEQCALRANCIAQKCNGPSSVTFLRHHKWQKDNSLQRVQNLRARNRVTPIEEEGRRKRKKEEKKKNTPPTPPQGAIARFERFYAAYPKKRARGDAEKAWRQISPDEELLCKMLVAVESQRKSFDWSKEGGQFIPLPATWLRQKRWDDQEQETLMSVAPKVKYCASCGYTLTVHTLKQHGRTELYGLGSLEKVCGSYQAADSDLPENL